MPPVRIAGGRVFDPAAAAALAAVVDVMVVEVAMDAPATVLAVVVADEAREAAEGDGGRDRAVGVTGAPNTCGRAGKGKVRKREKILEKDKERKRLTK